MIWRDVLEVIWQSLLLMSTLPAWGFPHCSCFPLHNVRLHRKPAQPPLYRSHRNVTSSNGGKKHLAEKGLKRPLRWEGGYFDSPGPLEVLASCLALLSGTWSPNWPVAFDNPLPIPGLFWHAPLPPFPYSQPAILLSMLSYVVDYVGTSIPSPAHC